MDYLRIQQTMEELEMDLYRYREMEIAKLDDLADATFYYLKDYVEVTEVLNHSLHMISHQQDAVVQQYKAEQRQLKRAMEDHYEDYLYRLKLMDIKGESFDGDHRSAY